MEFINIRPAFIRGYVGGGGVGVGKLNALTKKQDDTNSRI